jgi:hypothetical protein
MNSKEKREEIVALIDNIKEHSDRLNKMPHMPLLEVSAILSKINKLHENTVVLKYLLATEQHFEEEEFSIDVPSELADESEEEATDLSSIQADLEEDPEDIDQFDDETDQDDDLDVDESKIDLKGEFEQVEEKIKAESKIDQIADQSGMSSHSDINEQYADEQEDRSLSEQLKKQPISDLLTAIGLNERYLYANDLFGGDIEEFRKAIRLLNELDSEEEASRYFNEELRRAYGWEDDNELAQALYLLVKRRFQG